MSEGYFAIPKKAFEDAMKLLDAVPTRNGISSSEFIKTELKDSKHLHMSLASEMYGLAVVPVAAKKNFSTTLYLDRRMLKPFVAEGTELNSSDLYEFTVVDKLITVKNGSRYAKLENSHSATGYEKMPNIKEGVSIDLQEEWTSITNCATLCACTDPIAPALNCVHLEPKDGKVYVRASDTKLVYQGTLNAAAFPCKQSVALPLDLVDEINLFSTGVCHYSQKWAMLHFAIGYLWQPVKTECRKSFPVKPIADIVAEIAKHGKVVSVIGTQSLVEAADRISRYMQAAMRDNPALTLTIKKGLKKARLSSSTIGASFDESLLLEEKAEEDYIVEWPLQAVLPILQYCKNAGSARIIQDATGKTCLKAGKVTLVVPKKTSNKKSKKKKGK